MSLNSEDYWRKREEEQRKQDIKDLKEYRKHLEGIYKRTLADVSSQIRAFYNQYAQKTGMTYAEAMKKADKLDIEAFAEKAKQYVKDKDFSKKANEEMRLYNMTMKANRLELLKAQIGLELCSTADEIDKFMKEELRGRTLEEIERQAGILGQSLVNNKEFANALINASFHNATFSDRIWVNQSALRNNLDSILKNALIQGRNPRDFIPELRKIFDVSRYQAERLLRTELARVQTEAQMQSYKRNGFTQYKFMALGSACEICAAINGDVFDVEDAEPGLNMPPMHPNCMCSTAPYEDTTDFDNWLNGIDEHGLRFNDWKKHKNKLRFKLDIQAFGKSQENDLKRQSITSLNRGIRKLQKQIEEHERKIADPASFYPEWDQHPEAFKQGCMKHWKKEINNFKESIKNRENEIKYRQKRGDHDEED